MKITDVRCVIFEWTSPQFEFKGPMRRLLGHRSVPHMIVRVLTDEGIEGNSSQYVTGNKGLAEHIETVLRSRLVGEDPIYVEAVWQKLWRLGRNTHPHKFIQGTIDVCLWDIAGKASGLPIYKMLGGYRDKVPAYASSQGYPTIEAIVEEAGNCIQQGYKGYKVHPFDPDHADPKKDVEACIALRKALGDDIALMLDPYGLYNREQSLWVGRQLEELNFVWLEEPMPEWDIEGYSKLCEALDIPILGPEIVGGSMFSTPEYILRRAVDIVRSDVRIKGGIGPLKKTAGMAEAFGMNIEIHTCAAPLFNVANLHVMCSIRNSDYHEVMVPAEWFSAGVVEDVKIDKEGYVTLPDKPGLGLEIDWKYIDKHKIYETPPL